jgi:uncharacterized protein YybS (DUF2232 family)
MNNLVGEFVPQDAAGSASTGRSVINSAFFALALLLPGINLAIFGWVYFMIPVMVLLYMYRWQHGLRFVTAGFVLAALASLFISSIALVIATATLIPVGITLCQSAFRGESATRSGLKGSVVLCSCWLILLAIQTMLTGVNPVTDFIAALNGNIEAALAYYRQSSSVTPETMVLLEDSFHQMKIIFPRILPALMIGLILMINWSTMIIGNRLVNRYTAYRPWPAHQYWRLPDRLIWVFIASALITLPPLPLLRTVGINLLICLGLIYMFQGFSVLSFYLHKWKVPHLLRYFLYVMMLFQSFGTVLLLIAGVADVWLDIRRLKHDNDEKTNDE